MERLQVIGTFKKGCVLPQKQNPAFLSQSLVVSPDLAAWVVSMTTVNVGDQPSNTDTEVADHLEEMKNITLPTKNNSHARRFAEGR